jgi:hypothetical protein
VDAVMCFTNARAESGSNGTVSSFIESHRFLIPRFTSQSFKTCQIQERPATPPPGLHITWEVKVGVLMTVV